MSFVGDRRENAAMRLRWWRLGMAARGLPARVYLGPHASVDIGKNSHLNMGDNIVFKGGAVLTIQGTLEVGEGVYFNHSAHITCLDNIKIGRGSRFGERVSIHDENHA